MKLIIRMKWGKCWKTAKKKKNYIKDNEKKESIRTEISNPEELSISPSLQKIVEGQHVFPA